MKSSKLAFVASGLLTLLVGCGGGGGGGSSSSSTPAVAATYVGNYIDAPVKGLVYTASPSGLTGTTDTDGKFEFQSGDTVSFRINTPNGEIDAGLLKPTAPSNASEVVKVHVLSMDNGVQIAQTLQSLGGNGSYLDLSSTSNNVKNISASEAEAINNFVGQGGVGTPPAKLTVTKDAAKQAALNSLASIASTASTSTQISDADMSGGLLVYQSSATVNGRTFKLESSGIDYFSADKKIANLCVNRPNIDSTDKLNITFCSTNNTTKGTWAIDSGKLTTLADGSTAKNTITLTNPKANAGIYSATIDTSGLGLPSGISVSGSYTQLDSTLSISKLASRTVITSGEAVCSDGKGKIVFNSDGSTFTFSCLKGNAAGYTFTTLEGKQSDVAEIPGILKVTVGTNTPFYTGLVKGGSIDSGTTVNIVQGSQTCLTDSTKCGSITYSNFSSTLSTDPQGIWTGTTSTGYTVNTMILENGEAWGIYTSGSTIYGALNGTATTDANSAITVSGFDFNFLTNSAVQGSYVGTFSPKSSISLTGSTSKSTVSLTYNSAYDAKASAADVVGTWSFVGRSAANTLSPDSIKIDAAGKFSLTQSNCTTTGSLVPRASGKNVFNVNLTSSGTGCAAGQNSLSGVAYLDKSTKPYKFLALGLTPSKSDGLIIIGTKQ
jgi:hypothetical protein